MTIKVFFLYILLGSMVLTSFSCSKEDDLPDLPIKNFAGRTQDFSLWQLDQYYGKSQMGYLIKTDDEKIIVVDGGLDTSSEILENFLMQLGGEVHTWITTHPHRDHIGALTEIIRSDKVTIHRILHTALDKELVRLHEPISFALVKKYYTVLENSKIRILDVSQGEIFSLGDGIELQILGSKNDNILVNLVNNSSLVFKISSKSKSVLFLGDLGVEGGQEILKNVDHSELRANYVQMAHHGQDGVDKSFYETVGCQYALWPTPAWLWENNLDAKGYNTGNWKIFTVRNWMKELNIKKNYVSGLEGTIQID